MRTEVHVHGTIYLCEGVSRKQVENALRPWLDYLDVERMEEAKSLEPEQPGIAFHAKDRVLELCWTGAIGRSFEQKLEETMQGLGPLTEQATEVEVSFYNDNDNGDDEMRLMFVGPTAEAIHEAQRRRMVEDLSSMMLRHFDHQSVDEVVALVNDLFRREWEEQAGSEDFSEPAFSGTVPPGRRHLH